MKKFDEWELENALEFINNLRIAGYDEYEIEQILDDELEE